MVDAEKAAAWNNHAEHDVYGNPDVVIRGRSLALLVDGINALSHVCRVPVHARQLFDALGVHVLKFGRVDAAPTGWRAAYRATDAKGCGWHG